MKSKKLIYILVLLNFLFSLIYIVSLNKRTYLFKNIFENYYKNEEKKFVHFSIDDTIEIFDDLTINSDKYNSIFENDTLKFLKSCNELYGAKFSIYCFYEQNEKNLSDFTDKFKKEFIENSNWLKFGFHAYNGERDYSNLSVEKTINDYNIVIKELKRIVGEEAITTVIRTDKFLGSEENILAMKKCDFGITGLLGADTINRTNYYLNNEENDILFKNDYYRDLSNDIFFYNTDLRIENIEDINLELDKLSNDKNIIIFTHEWALNYDNKNKIEKIFENLSNKGYIFEYPIKIEEE